MRRNWSSRSIRPPVTADLHAMEFRDCLLDLETSLQLKDKLNYSSKDAKYTGRTSADRLAQRLNLSHFPRTTKLIIQESQRT